MDEMRNKQNEKRIQSKVIASSIDIHDDIIIIIFVFVCVCIGAPVCILQININGIYI